MQSITTPTTVAPQPEGVVVRSPTHPDMEHKMRIKKLTAARRFVTIAAAISAAAAATAVTAAPASAAAGPVTTTGTVTTGTCDTQLMPGAGHVTIGCVDDSFSDWERANLTAPYTHMTPCRKILRGFGQYFAPISWERAQREYVRVDYYVRADDAVWARTTLATDADCNNTFDQKTSIDTGWVAKGASTEVTGSVNGTSQYASAKIKGIFNNKPMPNYVVDGPLVGPLP